jgi:hypothetical protein
VVRSPRSTRSWQSTSVFDPVASHVTITDPTHPLFGLTVPLVQTHPLATTSVVTIRLPTGKHRRVPRAATDLTEPPAGVTVAPVPLRPVSARTLLPLVPIVCRLLSATEESPDEKSLPAKPHPGGRDADNARSGADAASPQPVAGPRSRPTTPIGAVSGGTAPPSEPVGPVGRRRGCR